MALGSFTISTFNCKGFKPRNYNYLKQLFQKVDFLLLQELWLYDYESDIITKELSDSSYIAKSHMVSDKLREGRPFGGIAIVWKRSPSYFVTSIDTVSDRICACKLESQNSSILLINVYMPTNNANNNDLFTEILYEIISLCLMYDSYDIIVVGDFNCNVDNFDIKNDIF